MPNDISMSRNILLNSVYVHKVLVLDCRNIHLECTVLVYGVHFDTIISCRVWCSITCLNPF